MRELFKAKDKNCNCHWATLRQHNFFTNRVTEHWNKLPNIVVNAHNLISFKKRLDDLVTSGYYSSSGLRKFNYRSVNFITITILKLIKILKIYLSTENSARILNFWSKFDFVANWKKKIVVLCNSTLVSNNKIKYFLEKMYQYFIILKSKMFVD